MAKAPPIRAIEGLRGIAALGIVLYHTRAALAFAGDGELLPRLHEAARGVPDVHFLGFLNQSQLPRLYPAALLPLAALGLVEKDRATRRGRIALALLAPVALALYSLDLCRANMARVHVPGALVVTMLAAAGLARLWTSARSPAARTAIVLVLITMAVPTALRLWQPTNEQAEEALIRESLAHLSTEKGPFTLVRMAREDRDPTAPGSAFTHHHFPDYLVRPPAGEGRVSSISDWIGEPDLDRPAFFYLGVRCYAEFREQGTPPPHGDTLQPACARLRERFDLAPVFERDIPNRGDVWIEYYGDSPSLRVGLYRIRPKQLSRP